MGATNVGEERAPPATAVNHKDDLEKQQETNPLKPAAGSGEKAPVKKTKGKGKGKNAAAKSNKAGGIVVAALIVFFGLFALITWLSIRPVDKARCSMDNIQIKSLAVNPTDSTVDADFSYNITAYNGNRKLDFKYAWIIIDASYRALNIGRGNIRKFKVRKASSSTKTTEMSVRKLTRPEPWATSLAAAIKKGSVPLRVYAKAKLQVRIGKLIVSAPQSLHLDCRLVVEPPSPTTPGKVVSKTCRQTRPRYKKAKK